MFSKLEVLLLYFPLSKSEKGNYYIKYIKNKKSLYIHDHMVTISYSKKCERSKYFYEINICLTKKEIIHLFFIQKNMGDTSAFLLLLFREKKVKDHRHYPVTTCFTIQET